MARGVFEGFFHRRWNLRKPQKEFTRAAREVIRLRNRYPEVYAEVLQGLGLNVEEWREFKAYLDQRPADDKSNADSV